MPKVSATPRVRSQVKLDPFPAPTFDAAPILALIDRLVFKQARAKNRWGRPQIPHSYVVRGRPPDIEALYVALFAAIQQHGRDERYSGRRKKYLYPGDGRKYWAMTTDLTTSGVLNRMLIEDDLDRLRREGQID
jgi:hypothetical protein